MTDEKVWLVKSSGSILGPYSTPDVEMKIKRREVMPLDEITSVFGRWHYLRDIEIFARIFIVLKNKEEFFPGTVTETVGGDTNTESAPTHSIGITGFGSLNNLNSLVDDEETGKIPSRAVVDGETKDVKAQPGSSSETKSEKPSVNIKTFASTADPRTARRVSLLSSQRSLWVIALLLVGVLIGIQLQSRHNGVIASRDFNSVVAEGFKAKKRGEWDKAKDLFSQALVIRPDDTTVILQLAPLLIKTEDTVMAKRLLEGLLARTTDANQRTSAFNLIAMASMKNGDFDRSDDYLSEALKLNPQFGPALHNRAAAAAIKNTFGPSLTILKRVIGTAGEDPITVLLFADTIYRSRRAEGAVSEELISEGLKELARLTSKTYDYRQEAEILRARLLLASNQSQTDEAVHALESALDEDPQLTQDHVHSLEYFDDFLAWENVSKWIDEAVRDVPPNPRMKGLSGLGLFRGREKLEGKRAIIDAVEQAPQDPILLALKGYVLVGLPLDAETQVGLALEHAHAEKLPHIFRGRNCLQRNDWTCARESWEAVLKIDPKYPPAVSGLYEVLKAQNQTQEANTLMLAQTSSSPNYGPYIKFMLDSKLPPK